MDPVTVMVDVPELPSMVAVMVTCPENTPVTRPPLLTVAMALFPLDQETERPFSTAPAADLGVAETWVVWPVAMDPVVGETETWETGSMTMVT
jgi:hypothetical protein